MDLGALVKEYRISNNITMQEFADRGDLSKGYISMLEKGENPQTKKPIIPSLETIKKCAVAMNIPFDELLSKIDDTLINISTDIIPIEHYLESGYSTIRVVPFGGSCGNGIINDGSQKTIKYPTELLGKEKNEDEYFISYAKGISMERAGIHDGDLLLFHEQPTLENNEIGFFTLNDEEYIKRFKNTKNGIMLVSESYSDGFEPLIISEDDQFIIRAKLYKVVKDFE